MEYLDFVVLIFEVVDDYFTKVVYNFTYITQLYEIFTFNYIFWINIIILA